jgi:hypothetical protein
MQMEWNHLPIAGGIWDQDPELLDSFLIIWSEYAKKQKEDERKEKMNKTGKG